MYCWDCQAPSKGVSEQKHPPHSQLSSLGVRMNAEWERMDTISPITLQEDISAFFSLETLLWAFSLSEAQQWIPLCETNFFFPLIFHAFGPSTPVSRCAVWLHGWMGHGHNFIHAFPVLYLYRTCYQWCASELSKMQTRKLRNSYTVPYPNIRIYYMLIHKHHIGLKIFFL